MVDKNLYKIVTVTTTTITKAGEHPVQIKTTEEKYSDTPPDGYEDAVRVVDQASEEIQEAMDLMLEDMDSLLERTDDS